jgi:hypothetical protein
MSNHSPLPQDDSSIILLKPLPLRLTRSPEDKFKRTVMDNRKQFDLLLRFAFAEYSECVMFLYDAIQDIKETSMEQLQPIMLISAFDMYVTANFRITAHMEVGIYESISDAVDRMRHAIQTRQDVQLVIKLLDTLTTHTLMEMYQRLLDVQEKKGEFNTPTQAIDPETVTRMGLRKVSPYQKEEPEKHIVSGKPLRRVRSALKRLSVRISTKLL